MVAEDRSRQKDPFCLCTGVQYIRTAGAAPASGPAGQLHCSSSGSPAPLRPAAGAGGGLVVRCVWLVVLGVLLVVFISDAGIKELKS